MTSGTRTIDGRFTVDSFCAVAPNNKAGPYYSKTWSGADRVPDQKIVDVVWDPDRKRYFRKTRRIRRKQVPHDYTMTLVKQSWPQIRVKHTNGTYPACTSAAENRWWTFTCIYYPSSQDWGVSPWTTNHDWELLSNLQQKVNGSSFDPGVFFAESGKSLKMIGESARRIARAAYYARKGDVRRAWEAFGTTTPSGRKINVPKNTSMTANNWAEYRWGWVPLYQDMHDGAVWIAHKLYAPAMFRISARRSARKKLGVFKNPNIYPGLISGTNEWIVRKQIIAYLTEAPSVSALDVVDPLTIAWELIPLSFVVDWALPIGRYLSLRGLPSQLHGTFVNTTTVTKRSADITVNNPSGSCPMIKVATYWGTGESLNMQVTRTVTSSIQLPPIEFRGFEKVATWKHAVDAIALMTQRLKKLQVD